MNPDEVAMPHKSSNWRTHPLTQFDTTKEGKELPPWAVRGVCRRGAGCMEIIVSRSEWASYERDWLKSSDANPKTADGEEMGSE